MRAQRAAMTYYVLYETGEHGHHEPYDTIFEALAEYYQTISEGPTSAGEEVMLEVELGEIDEDNMWPLLTHSFEDDENTNNRTSKTS